MVLHNESHSQELVGGFIKINSHPFFKLFVLDTATKYNELAVLLQQRLTNVLRENNRRLNDLKQGLTDNSIQEITDLKGYIKANEKLLSSIEHTLENPLPNIQYQFNLPQSEIYDSTQLFTDLDVKLTERFQEVKSVIERSDLVYASNELDTLEADILVFYKNEKKFNGYWNQLNESVTKEVDALVDNIRDIHSFHESPSMENFYPSTIHEHLFTDLAISYMHEEVEANSDLFGAYSLSVKGEASVEIEKKITESAWCQYNKESEKCFRNTMNAVRLIAQKTLSEEQNKFIQFTNISNCVVTGRENGRAFEIPTRGSFTLNQEAPISIKKLNVNKIEVQKKSIDKSSNRLMDREL
ncbi:DNA polymerase III [Listeria monocytogenes]|nr:DNA polymerase III [Listeria monocytogenes]EAD5426693.1 DNA polymerase III [Listeria monocytogenes]EAE8037117.1 DNA polymerase III [Listeria monocytogenes]EAE8046262.1 DNA polymerase III [Listeria monocytogenes]